MKKTLVALAVAMTAASASATTVYENEGTKVEIGGRVDVMLGKFGKDERTDLRNNESRIDIHAEHNISNGLKALAHYRVRFNKGGDRGDTDRSFNDPTTNKLWLGLAHADVGTLTFGKQDTTGDAVQLNDEAYIFGGNNNLNTGGDKVASFRTADFKLGGNQTLGFGVDYEFGNSDKTSNKPEKPLKNAYGVSSFYAGSFGDFGVKFNAGYTYEKDDRHAYPTDTKTGDKRRAWRLASDFSFGPASFGLEYGRTDHKEQSTYQRDRFFLVGAEFQVVEPSKVYFQYQNNQEKIVATGRKTTENKYIVGADYQFNKNVLVYTELARSLVKENTSPVTKSNDTMYGVGLRVYF